MHDPTPSNDAEATLASIKQRLEQIANSKLEFAYDEYEEHRFEGEVDLAGKLLDEFFR